MLRRYSGKGNSSPGVLMVATSVPVLGVSPGAGVTGGAVCGGASFGGSVRGGGFGSGAVGVLGGFGLGLTGAGFSCGGRGTASVASLFFSVRAGAATSSTA